LNCHHGQVKFEGEDGVDAGVLFREFFTKFLEKIFSDEMGLFSGATGRLWPTHNIAALRCGSFKTYWHMPLYSLQLAFRFSPRHFYAQISSIGDEEVMRLMTTEDIAEGEKKAMILKYITLVRLELLGFGFAFSILFSCLNVNQARSGGI
jgi:hypothetical protein